MKMVTYNKCLQQEIENSPEYIYKVMNKFGLQKGNLPTVFSSYLSRDINHTIINTRTRIGNRRTYVST